MINVNTIKIFLLISIIGCWGCEEENPTGPQLVTGAVIDAEVGGPEQPNQVFIDLSTKTQKSVKRSHWDLGFYSGAEFRVILNSSLSSLARQLNKTNLNEVTAEDTTGWGKQLDVDAIFASLAGAPPAWIGQSAAWLDDPSGNLNATAIAEIAAADADNKVYIINRGKNPDNTQRGWLKIRILRNGSNYKIQHAAINATTFHEVSIPKNDAFNFSFLSIEDGIVNIEPEKGNWDIAFTTYTNLLPLDATTSIPYAYKDFVIHNRNTVKVARITIENGITYESYSKSNTEGLSFNEKINTIGSSWRIVAQPGTGQETDVNRTRFYIISDADGNIYKLRFTQLVNPTTGERGFPQIEYELL
jgi:hypothetical protein